MPQPKWLVIDSEIGVDQESWLITRLEQDILEDHKSFGAYCSKIADEFEAQFPPDQPRRLFEGKKKKQRYVRDETVEEARERTAGRHKVRNRPFTRRHW